MKCNIIYVEYVDDTIITCPNSGEIKEDFESLGTSNEDYAYNFQLCNEGKARDFIGKIILKISNKKIVLIQTGLIDKVLKAVDMESLNSVASPATTITTGIEINGVDYNKD